MYSFQSQIRYSELSPDKKLDIGSLLDYFQDCSTFHSESVDRGLDYLANAQKAWLLNSWQVVFPRLPSMCENITVCTWPYKFDRLFGYRNFLLKDENGKPCAYANSTWFYMDTEVMHPTKVSYDIIQAYTLEKQYDMSYEPRKIKHPKKLETIDSFQVKSCFIDTNLHVNNAQYIKMSLQYLPQNFKPIQLRAEYQNSALLGDSVLVKVKDEGNNFYIILCNKDEVPYTIIEFRKDITNL